jgi:hypothetical protein
MFTSLCKLELGNDRFVEVYSTKDNEHRIDLREWVRGQNTFYPTKKGVSFNLEIFKTLALSWDLIDTTLEKGDELNYHLGSNIMCTIQKDNPCVNIRKFWQPPNEQNLVPTKKGLCLRPAEYRALKTHQDEIEKIVPQLNTLVPCFMRDDHSNQLGMLQCSTCNPQEYMNW